MSSKRQHLQCIRGHYRYRRRYPKSVASVAGSEFFIRHLNTADLDEAVRKRPLVEAAYWAEVDRLKRLTDAQPRPLTENEALALAATWFAESNRELDARHRDEPTPPAIRQDVIGDAEYVVGMASDALADSSLDAITPLAERLLERRGMRAEPESAGYRTLLQLLWRGMKELNQVDLARLRGDFGYAPADPVFAAALREPPKVQARHTIGTLIEAFKSDRADKWSKSTENTYGPVERLLRDVLGTTRDLSTIGRTEGRELFEAVKSLPKGLGTVKALKGLSVPEAIRRGAELGLPKLSAKSINDSYLSMLKATFKFAVDEQWMAASPMQGLRVGDEVHNADRRDPFTTDQLNVLFAAEPWAGDPADAKPLHRWGPLIALFQGMRRGEIAQLATDDVREIGGVHVILVRSGNGKRTKTANARRMLPIHSELIRLGFLRYVEKRRRLRAAQLWQGEQPNGNGQWGDGFSDWFNRLLKARGITEGTRLGMHSFRHNFQDALREAGLHGTAIGQELAGRSKGGDTSNDYGSNFSTAALAEAIERIRYPGLKLLTA